MFQFFLTFEDLNKDCYETFDFLNFCINNVFILKILLIWIGIQSFNKFKVKTKFKNIHFSKCTIFLNFLSILQFSSPYIIFCIVVHLKTFYDKPTFLFIIVSKCFSINMFLMFDNNLLDKRKMYTS